MSKKLIWTMCMMMVFAPLQSKAEQNCRYIADSTFKRSCVSIDVNNDCILTAWCRKRDAAIPPVPSSLDLKTCPVPKDIVNCEGTLKCGGC